MDDNPALLEVKDYVHEMYNLEEQLVEKIDSLPSHGGHLNSLDEVFYVRSFDLHTLLHPSALLVHWIKYMYVKWP